jgi:uncharacterized protein YbbC (DUF1343 family)
MNKIIIYILLFFCWQLHVKAQSPTTIVTGAEQTNKYLPLLENKSVAIFANQTTLIHTTHLVDSLLKLNIHIVKIFGPEHGFRGTADAGETIKNGLDIESGLPVVSLYGNHKKPTPEDLKDIDVMLYDIQDVGVRFYTYISSFQYFLEAAIENNKTMIVLDRPNPNGFYVDGPVLDTAFRSFIGMQPIPIVYGMTIAEYAKMLIGERWLSAPANQLISSSTHNTANQIHLITCLNYSHESKYILPKNPSPNLKEMQSVYLYPSICFFEGTVISEGRGTSKPFQIFGHPSFPSNLYAFTPLPNEGAKNSKCYYQKCYGWNLADSQQNILKNLNKKIQIKFLQEAYRLFPEKDSFFIEKKATINKIAGNDIFVNQIINNVPEKRIRESWEPQLSAFKAIRKKYLLYKDFKN